MMKKLFMMILTLVFLSISISVILYGSGEENGESKTPLTIHNYIYSSAKRSIDRDKAREKYERHRQYNQRKQELHQRESRFYTMDSTEQKGAVQITANNESLNDTTDYSGNFMLLGTCTNNGSSSAVFVEAKVELYGIGGNYLDYEFTYISGGSNVKLNGTGSYTNALEPGQTGFFKVYTSYPASQVGSYHVTFPYDTYGFTPAYASLEFDNGPSWSSYASNLRATGTVRNNSSAFLTYFTTINFAIFDAYDRTIDVDFTFVDGATYQYMSGLTTDTAIYPGENEPFTNYFSYSTLSQADSYMNSFEWNEANTSGMGENNPPFGSFDSPLDHANVASSIPVTGWALDDSGVDSVKIYREDGGTLVYVGEAAFVKGARPDVAADYPEYNNNTRAGWGYQMLTNFLPNGGNGTYVIHAIATDAVGKTTTLGIKTIYCDNANAIKPFGALDTPTQGGSASGYNFINWGWVLTPQPKTIPKDGSTINVFVDGVNLGHPHYNNYRSDIATLFPGYNNSDGASGYFFLDTFSYFDGVHSIYWYAKDDDNKRDGIGSRFFQINNWGGDVAEAQNNEENQNRMKKRQKRLLHTVNQVRQIAVDRTTPIQMRMGFNDETDAVTAPIDNSGTVHIQIQPNQRMTLLIANETARPPISISPVPSASQATASGTSSKQYFGYLLLNDQLHPLPIGSTLDSTTGAFYWIPGPGFKGKFHLVFLEKNNPGTLSRRDAIIDVTEVASEK